MAAAQMNNQVARLSKDELARLPPAKKVSFSSSLANERLLHRVPHRHRTSGRIYIPPGVVRVDVPKRALNSWIAFRTWYSKIFGTAQQKESSVFLTAMWQKDPFKAKWGIVAKAYSGIRDHLGKRQAPLDTFLALICPKIGIIPVEAYLSTMNWSFEVYHDDSKSLQQSSEPDFATFPKAIMTTTMTERDVVNYCGQMGYITAIEAAAIINRHFTVASNIAGVHMPQQGLLAGAPVIPQPQIQNIAAMNDNIAQQQEESNPPTASTQANFFQSVITAPRDAAAMVLGFDVNNFLEIGKFTGDYQQNDILPHLNTACSVPYDWASTMPDLSDPNIGSFDLSELMKPAMNRFNMIDAADPRQFDTFINYGPLNGPCHTVTNGYTPPNGKSTTLLIWFSRHYSTIGICC
ncbi:mating-type protein MAT alpha 1-domain-containing protein [Xylogone sp. PMI_703]|nr:mating-type protein MAT alpha 1-domain-containing protein [Xylogone sp. PMI_703]